jgi:hypothetical protein
VVNFETNSPIAIVAEYRPQHLPQFKGNPMIEALPKAMSNDELFEAMTLLPEFTPEQQAWPDEDRIQMIVSLSNFMIPSKRHVKLGRALDSMLRGGYVGRIPRTVEHAKRLQKTYESAVSQRPSPMATLTNNPQLSTLLMGLPGMGKTTSVKRFFSHFPQVIYHPAHHVYQVTYLHVEMPSDGASIKALAYGILHQLDKLIPGANYYKTHTTIKQSADALMRGIARLLHQHFVGFLIADEIQNLTNANSGKGKQTVMTELVSACNDLGVPILFIGTNKAAQVFSLDFRTSRRASGHGIEHWDRLDEIMTIDSGIEGDGRQERSEWNQQPVELNAALSSTMYHLSQGVIDVAIKIFASAQVRAIFDKSEKVTVELLSDVYKTEMQRLHPMLCALRDINSPDLSQFADIAPVGIQEMVNIAAKKVRLKTSDAYAIKPTDADFVPRVAAALVAGGIEEDLALEASDFVLKEGRAKNLDEGVERARQYVKSLKDTKPVKEKRAKATDDTTNIVEYKPGDYRNAIALATKGKTTVYQQLQKLGMAKPLGELLNLD